LGREKEETLVFLPFSKVTFTDADRDDWEYMWKKGKDIELEPPRRMTTRSQTRAAAED
jgi:hypothetical protein